MNGKTKNKANRAERGCAWAATFLLAVFLLAAFLSTVAVQAMTSAGLHLQAATDGDVLESQMTRIHGKIDQMAEEHGFPAETVKAAVSKDELEKLNREAAAWWTRLLTEGKADDFPRWNTDSIEEAVYAAVQAGNTDEDPRTIVAELADQIERAVLPVRELLLSFGMEFVNEQADVAGMIRAVRKIPMLCLALCALTAGVIALLLGREMLLSLKYYGTAAAAAGFLILAAGTMMMTLHVREIIAQASGELAGVFRALEGRIGTEGGLIALGLIAAGYACLILYRRKMAGGGSPAEGIQ